MEIPDAVSPEDFEVLLKEPLGEHWERVKVVFDNFGELHQRSMTCLFDIATQKDRVEPVINALEQAWEGWLSYIPDPITTGVEIKMLFDVIYADIFRDVIAERFPGIKIYTPADLRNTERPI